VDGVTAELRAGGFDVQPCAVSASGPAVEATRAAARRGVGVVFALGGDGTVRDAAAGVCGSPAALGVLPAGTTNVVARALGIPLDPLAAARRMSSLPPRAIDLGLCGGRPFLMQATAGFDASLMARVDRRWKARFGRLAIACQGLAHMLRYGYPEIEVRVDERPRRARQVAVCNIPEYAGSFRIAPDGRCDDRRLDVVLFQGHGLRATLSFYLDLARGVHARRPDVELLSAETVEVLGPAGGDVQIDGDPIGDALPIEVRLAPEPLRVLAPAPSA